MTAARLEAERVYRRRVYAKVRAAVKAGRIKKPEACERCGAPDPGSHHPDYSKPFRVKWLCPACHAAEHARLRARAKGRRPKP